MPEIMSSSLSIAEEFALRVRRNNRKERMMQYAPMIVLVALVLMFSAICGPDFASLSNFVAILNQLAIPMVVALGLTFVIMIGGIDLSIDGAVGMASALVGALVLNNRYPYDWGLWGVLAAIGASTLVGFAIGMIHVHLKIPSFMVSFAFMHICRGLGLMSYEGRPPTIMDPLLASLPKISYLGVPFITWAAVAVLLVCVYIQEYTAFGRYIYAVGTDESILHSVGVSVNRVKVKVFTLAGVCFGIAGVLGAIRLGLGEVMVGSGLMFPAQAAVVVGGTSLAGGKGGVINTIVGVLIMTVLANGLIVLGVNPYVRTGIQGVIILVAVALTVARGAKVISK